MKHNYVVIEGNIGAGKTTLVQLLAQSLGARAIYEEFSDNPFLPLFYKEPERYSFSLEMSFLADRYHQLGKTQVADLFQPMLLADYSIFKSWIFAQNNLEGKELALYKNLFGILAENLPKPDLIIYLNRSMDRLKRHIQIRGRSYEQKIADVYLKNLQESYISFFKQMEQIPVVIVDADAYDFLYKASDLEIFKTILDADFHPGINFLK